jgi:hypothetical protein
MKLVYISETIRGWLGWCPNHPAPSAGTLKPGSKLHIVLIACLVCVPVAALLMTGGVVHEDAIWIFSRDSSGTAHFVTRAEAPQAAIALLYPDSGDTPTSMLPGGSYFMFIQHPGPDGTFDVVLEGDYVKNQHFNPPGTTGGAIMFRIFGPGSLQGDDAYEALTYAINDPPTLNSEDA